MLRQEKGIKNVTVTLIFYLISMLLAFFSRKIFIDYLGENIVGLNTTIVNILGFLNLAELGVTSAIATALYKPLYRQDKEAISDIISIFNYLYHIIGYVILGIGIVIIFFLPTFFEGKGIDMPYIYLAYFVFLSTNLVSYFISYKQILLTADQRDYVIVTWTKIFNIVKVICQIVALRFLDFGYIVWLGIEFIFGISYGFWINGQVTKIYPWLKSDFLHGKTVCKEYKDMFVKIKQIIPHRLSGFVLSQTGNIILFAVTSSFAIVTLYNNYLILIGSITLMFVVASNGLYAGVGNLIAEGNKETIKALFFELTSFYFYIGGVIVICLIFLTEPFIGLWLGKQYIVDPVIFYLILFNSSITIFRLPVELFLNGYILYKDTWAPITEAILNLTISIGLGYKFGLIGVVLGTTVSLGAIVCIWRPIFLHRCGFKERIFPYWRKIALYLTLMVISFLVVKGCVSLFIGHPYSNYYYFFVNGFLIFLTTAIVYGGLLYLFSKGMRRMIHKLLQLIKNKFVRCYTR